MKLLLDKSLKVTFRLIQPKGKIAASEMVDNAAHLPTRGALGATAYLSDVWPENRSIGTTNQVTVESRQEKIRR